MRLLLLLLLLCTANLHAKATVCLNMIVKNETRVICRCLDSVKDLIDYWVIVDTGSTDGSQQLIKEHMQKLGIAGEVHERPWVDYSYNRNQALALAKDKADYVLFMDADDWLEYPTNYTLPDLQADSYDIEFTNGHCSYLKPHLVRTALDWQWRGVLHECLCCDTPYSKLPLDHVRYVIGNDGSSYDDPEKYLKHAHIFEEELRKNPQDRQAAYYCAQSYKDARKPKEALKWYLLRAEMGGWDEQVYWSLVQAGHLYQQLECAPEKIISTYYKAHRFRPHRSEAPYYLAAYYNQHGNPQMGYATIKAWQSVVQPAQRDIYFSDDWTYKYGMLMQQSIGAYWIGLYQESYDLSEKLLQMEDLPESWRKQAQINLSYAKQMVMQENPPCDPEKTSVLLAILARNKAHTLPHFLHCIENQEYNKSLVTVYINTNDNEDATAALLRDWASKWQEEYKEIIFEEGAYGLAQTLPHEWTEERFGVLAAIRNKSLYLTREKGCDFYFVVDCDNFIVPETLKTLVTKNKPIIAPMLRAFPEPLDNYTNFFCDVTESGYYQDHSDYRPILFREKVGTFCVPLVHCTYLVRADVIDSLSYIDGTAAHEFVVFARSAREHNIEQYICNEVPFGLLIHFMEEREKVIWTREIEQAAFNTFIERNELMNRLRVS